MMIPTSPYGMDMVSDEIDAGELLDSMPSPKQIDNNNQTAAWYATDL